MARAQRWRAVGVEQRGYLIARVESRSSGEIVGVYRRLAALIRERATSEIAALLRQVPGTKGITMAEAAELVGVSRAMAYKMLS